MCLYLFAKGRDLIGAEAEQIVWLWCSIRRDTIELGNPAGAVDRRSGDRVELSEQQLDDITTLWAADTVEQIGRMALEERRFAHGLPTVLHRASPQARSAVQSILPLLEER